MKKISCIILLVLCIIVSGNTRVSAGYLAGDEALGGFSYLMQCAYENRIPTGMYSDWYYRAYHRFHYEIPLDEESRAILERIVEAEATGGNVSQKMNVASCVLARVQSTDWPDTVKDVVFQVTGGTYQFTPLKDGRYYTVTITDATKEAVENVSKSGLTHSCLWFCSKGSYDNKDENGEYTSWHRRHLKYAFYDEEHVYFY